MRGGQASALWQRCFHDETAFVRLFFRKLYRRRQFFSVVRKGRIVASLHLIPYGWTGKEGEEPLRLAYIVGCCTHPAWRGRGYMRRLLEEAVAAAERQGFDVAALIPATPALFGYYAASGFTTACSFGHLSCAAPHVSCTAPHVSCTAPHVSCTAPHVSCAAPHVSCAAPFEGFTDGYANPRATRLLRLDGRHAERFYPFFSRRWNRRENCIRLNALQFRAAVADAAIDGGGAYALQNGNGTTLALAFVTSPPPLCSPPPPPHTLDRIPLVNKTPVTGASVKPPLRGLYIKEMVAADEEARQAILSRILALYRSPQAICRIPANVPGQDSPPTPYGMVRPLSDRYAPRPQADGYLNLMLD